MKHRTIEFYETGSGRCPVADYLTETLRIRKERARIMKAFEAVQANDVLPSKIFKKLSGRSGLWEIRIDQYRVLCFYAPGDVLVFVSIFLKKSQKTPQPEIELAIQRKKAYESRPEKPR